MSIQPATNRQLPDHAILDLGGKATYLGNQYSYLDVVQSVVTTEAPILLLSNPAVSAASFPSQYQALFCNLRSLTCMTSGDTAILRAYIGPTFSAAGTPVVPINMRPASPNASIAAVSSVPTVSANGSNADILTSFSFNMDASASLIILDPGQSLLLTLQTSANPTVVGVGLSWYEL